jgi:hypothetical protein
MDFRREEITKMIHKAMKRQIILLYAQGKKEAEVEEDARRGVKNIAEWMDMVFKPNKNQFGLKFERFLAAEQEFTTFTYGIRSKIDGTLVMKDKNGISLPTALEIKTGKYKNMGYRG